MRICSLLPGATDILVALGLRDHLVAVTHECELAPGAKIPAITHSTFQSKTPTSRDIDRLL
jgi:iron complex transport system substrate-binding protein